MQTPAPKDSLDTILEVLAIECLDIVESYSNKAMHRALRTFCYAYYGEGIRLLLSAIITFHFGLTDSMKRMQNSQASSLIYMASNGCLMEVTLLPGGMISIGCTLPCGRIEETVLNLNWFVVTTDLTCCDALCRLEELDVKSSKLKFAELLNDPAVAVAVGMALLLTRAKGKLTSSIDLSNNHRVIVSVLDGGDFVIETGNPNKPHCARVMLSDLLRYPNTVDGHIHKQLSTNMH